MRISLIRPVLLVVLAFSLLSASSAIAKDATSSTAMNECLRAPVPTIVTGCPLARGIPTIIGIQTSMKMFGRRMTWVIPLLRRCSSEAALACMKGLGLAGSAPRAPRERESAAAAVV